MLQLLSRALLSIAMTSKAFVYMETTLGARERNRTFSILLKAVLQLTWGPDQPPPPLSNTGLLWCRQPMGFMVNNIGPNVKPRFLAWCKKPTTHWGQPICFFSFSPCGDSSSDFPFLCLESLAYNSLQFSFL